jgi:hypothetical protein
MNAHYPLNIAALAARYKDREFRRYIDSGFFQMQRCDRASTGSGDHAGYSRRRIMQAAITKSLTNLGVSISTASAAALAFSDEGQTDRAPGELFEYGKTLLVILPDGSTTVKNVFGDASLEEISTDAACSIVVKINKIVAQVDAIIGTTK